MIKAKIFHFSKLKAMPFLLIFSILISGCSVKFKSNKNKSKVFPDMIMGDFRYIAVNEQGKRDFVVKAGESKMFFSSNEVYLFNVTVSMYGANNKITSFVSANQGFMQQARYNIYFEGNVKILTDRGDILTANKLYYNRPTHKFYSEPGEKVSLTRDNFTVTGENMIADTSLNEITMDSSKAESKK